MGRVGQSKISAQIFEEAAEWFVEIDSDEVSLQAREQFDEWLRRSPEHVRAFLELLPVWEGVAATRSATDPTPQQLIGRFLEAQSNVVPLREPAGRTGPRARTPDHSTLWRAAAAVSIGIGVLTWVIMDRDTYRTSVGEHRSFTLDDGSQLEMNARSRIRIQFNAARREVVLLEGQAFFHVAKDPVRPFVVDIGTTRVQAVGTQFDVYRKMSNTVVTVVEGRVLVNDREHEGARVELASGEQVTLRHSFAPVVAENVNVSAAIGWTQQHLTFQKTPLADVVDEFNRYNKRPLRVEGEVLQKFRVSGTFSSTDPAPLLLFLRSQPGVQVIETAREIRIVGLNSPQP